MLANLALDGIQRLLKDHFSNTQASSRRNKVNMIRYADDFVITGSSKELLENEVKPLIVQFLRERGLELSEEKTLITHIEDGFDFLGQNVRKYNGKLIIKPSKRNVADFLANIREAVKGHKAIAAGELVRLLNLKIKGWAMYHRHICAKKTFKYVDYAIFKVLWWWCCRRHPEKGKAWVASKYFTHVPGPSGGNNWVFWGEVKSVRGEIRRMLLCRASTIPIRRHIKIKADVNPYDPKWAKYLQHRHSRPEHRSTPAQGSDEYAFINARRRALPMNYQTAPRPSRGV